MVPKGRKPNRLKKYRCIHGYSQKEVAEKLGMKNSNLIYEWEKGITSPSLENLLKLANLFHTLIEELFNEQWLTARSLVLPPNEQVRIIKDNKKEN